MVDQEGPTQVGTSRVIDRRRRAFVAAPFTSTLDDTGLMLPMARAFVLRVVEAVETAGYEVLNAHRREQWGEQLMGPHECVPLDLEGVRSADLFVALPGDPASGGVHIEIGWASAHGIPTVLLLNEDSRHSPLVIGLETVAPVRTVWWRTLDHCVEGLQAVLSSDELGKAIRALSITLNDEPGHEPRVRAAFSEQAFATAGLSELGNADSQSALPHTHRSTRL